MSATLTLAAWLALGALHAAPAAILFKPSMARSLYGVAPEGALGALLIHRGALFLTIVVAAVWAAFDPGARRLAGVTVAISMMGFLWVYLRAGAPSGALRTVAAMDAVGLAPLGWVMIDAWRG